MKDYKKILEGVVNIINTTEKSDIGFANICTYIGENCPELKESEDEKIRKHLIGVVELYYGKTDEQEKKDILAWLKKQEGCEYIKKDWLEHIKQSWYKEGFIDGKYSGGTSKELTINDAATLKELIDFLENGTVKLQHDLTKYANWLKIQFTPIEKQGEQKPNPCDGCVNRKGCINCENGELREVEQKSSWSEEDEKIYQSIMDDTIQENQLDGKQIDWLRNIKYRNFARPQKQWKPSKKQIMALRWVLNHIPYDSHKEEISGLLDQIKDL